VLALITRVRNENHVEVVVRLLRLRVQSKCPRAGHAGDGFLG